MIDKDLIIKKVLSKVGLTDKDPVHDELKRFMKEKLKVKVPPSILKEIIDIVRGDEPPPLSQIKKY